MSFDEFCDHVESHMSRKNGWTDIQVADFISPRTRRLIQSYQEGDTVESTATTLMAQEPGQMHLD